MNKMLKNIISRLTMVKSDQTGFYDKVGKCQIYFWRDYYFNEYMAESRWGSRIKLK